MSRLAAIAERRKALQAERAGLLAAVRAGHAQTASQVATMVLALSLARLARHWLGRLVRRRA